MHRAHVDHFPGQFGLDSVANKGLGSKKSALQVNIKYEIIVCFCDLPKWSALLDAGVVNQDIQPSKRLNGFRHHSLGVRYFADIPLDCHCPSTELFHALNGFSRCLWMRDIIDDDV